MKTRLTVRKGYAGRRRQKHNIHRDGLARLSLDAAFNDTDYSEWHVARHGPIGQHYRLPDARCLDPAGPAWTRG